MNNIVFNTGIITGNINQDYTEGKNGGKVNGDHMDSSDIKRSLFKYDVALSYASEQESYVSRVARILEKEGVNVFYAPHREEEFLGKDMITEFYELYKYESMFVACFISKDYLAKDITMHEMKTTLLREKNENRNCIIPVYFGNVRVKEINQDIHYLDAEQLKEVEVADKIKLIINTYKSNK